jgi:prepilin peptidase CpaA
MNIIMIFVLLLLLLIAAYQDYKNYRISNELVISGALMGILLNSFLSGGLGFTDSFIGWVTGLLLLLPLYFFRIMGAGDIKLMAMVGAFVGPLNIIVVFLYVMVSGGVLSILVAWHRGILQKLLCDVQITLHELAINLFVPKSKHSPSSVSIRKNIQKPGTRLPYGIAITTGTVIFLAQNHF